MPKCRGCGNSYPPEDFRRIDKTGADGVPNAVCKNCASVWNEENVVDFPEDRVRTAESLMNWNIDQEGFEVSLTQRGIEFSLRLHWSALKRAVKGNLIKAALGGE